MVWNVTKDNITERLAVVEEHTWAPPSTRPAQTPKAEDKKEIEEKLGIKLGFSDFIKSGFWDVDDVLRPIYENAGEIMGRHFPYPGDEEGEE